MPKTSKCFLLLSLLMLRRKSKEKVYHIRRKGDNL